MLLDVDLLRIQGVLELMGHSIIYIHWQDSMLGRLLIMV
jgi:hypothetical protein